jgi:8-oxo-dGTP pyrophosphatase MutT (NUDIX family)
MPSDCGGMSPNLRSSARAIILDEDDRVLFCRCVLPHPAVPGPEKAVWAAPSGGIEPGEDRLTALRRELREEIGLAIAADPPRIWRQIMVAADHASGFDGIINDYFLVRTNHFEPRGELTDNQLAAEENLTAFRWWQLPQIAGYTGPDPLSPRDLATETPTEPAQLGL